MKVLLRIDDITNITMPEVTVVGFRDTSFGRRFSSIASPNPASPSQGVGGGGRSRPTAPMPSADIDLQPVVVTATPIVPTITVTGSTAEDDWNTVPLPDGGNILVGAPKSLPLDLDPLQPPVRTVGPAQTFVGPSPQVQPSQPLPEVVVTARKPPSASIPFRPAVPPLFGLPPPLAVGFYFLFAPNTAGLGENERVAKMIEESQRERERRAAQALEPVPISVERLPEPVETVTVTASRLTDAPTGRGSSFVRVDPLNFQLARVREAFVPKPTSRLLPKPQTSRTTAPRLRSTKIGELPNVFSSLPSTLGRAPRVDPGPWPVPAPGPAPIARTPPRANTPLIPIAPDLTPSLTPQLGLQPQRVPPSTGRCVCPKVERKARKPRVECWRGTYTETSGGLIKSRKEKVPCR